MGCSLSQLSHFQTLSRTWGPESVFAVYFCNGFLCPDLSSSHVQWELKLLVDKLSSVKPELRLAYRKCLGNKLLMLSDMIVSISGEWTPEFIKCWGCCPPWPDTWWEWSSRCQNNWPLLCLPGKWLLKGQALSSILGLPLRMYELASSVLMGHSVGWGLKCAVPAANQASLELLGSREPTLQLLSSRTAEPGWAWHS